MKLTAALILRFFLEIMEYDEAIAEAKIEYGMFFLLAPEFWETLFYLQILPFSPLQDGTINFDDSSILLLPT